MSDTIPNIFPELPTRETIKTDLGMPLGFLTADGGFRVNPRDIDRLRRFLTVAERYSRFGLVSGVEHGEAISQRDALREHNGQIVQERGKALRKVKRLKERVKALRKSNAQNIAHCNDRLAERDNARDALAEAMRERTDHLSAIRALSLACGISFENGLKFRHIEFHKPSNVTIEPGAITIENPLQDATEAAARIVKSIQEISRPIGESLIDIPEVAERPTVGQSEEPTQIKTSRVEDLHRGDVIRFNHEDRTVTCLHHFGRDVQVCMADTDDVSSQPFFKTDRETLVDVVGFGAMTPAPEPEIPDEPVAVAAGGWCAPSDALYSFFPEITVERGGFSFTNPPKRKISKREWRERAERAGKYLETERKANRKLRRQVKRLRRFIEGA